MLLIQTKNLTTAWDGKLLLKYSQEANSTRSRSGVYFKIWRAEIVQMLWSTKKLLVRHWVLLLKNSQGFIKASSEKNKREVWRTMCINWEDLITKFVLMLSRKNMFLDTSMTWKDSLEEMWLKSKNGLHLEITLNHY